MFASNTSSCLKALADFSRTSVLSVGSQLACGTPEFLLLYSLYTWNVGKSEYSQTENSLNDSLPLLPG